MIKHLVATFSGVALLASLSLTPALAAHPQASKVTLNGSGSTFDAPLFGKAFPKYGHGVTVSYNAVGSGIGQHNLEAGLDDFGAFDVPMMKADLSAAKGPIVQFPVTLGGVGMIYHIKGVTGLRLTGSVLSDIFLGKITKWNDSAIKKLNPGKKLPGETIAVVHRSDSSGTSYIFTDYLSKVSSAWKKTTGGASKTPAWPTGSGAKGSSSVAALVKDTEGAIGYVEFAYAAENKIATAAIQNRAKAWVHASNADILDDARDFPHITGTSFSITNGKGKASYPISGYSWVGIYKTNSNKARRQALVGLFKWLVTAGQKYGPPLHYVQLPGQTRKYALNELAKVKA